MERHQYKTNMWTTQLMDAIICHAPINELQSLLDNGHNPDEVYHNGATALHVLVSSSAVCARYTEEDQKYYTAVLNLLFKKVKVVNPKNDFQQTPIELGIAVEVPVDMMTTFIFLWSKKLKSTPVVLYFKECPKSSYCIKYVKAIIRKGGNLYPVKRSRKDMQYISTSLLTKIFQCNYELSLEMLYVLLQAGLDISTFDKDHTSASSFASFVNTTITNSKFDQIPTILKHLILCGGQATLSHFCDKYFQKEIGIPLHGVQKIKFKIYSKLSTLSKEPMSLQNLSARKIRIQLHPNCFIGVQKLKCIASLSGTAEEIPSILKEIIMLHEY